VIVEIEIAGAETHARLLEPDDFRGFKVVVRGDGPPLAARGAPLGLLRVDEHAWVGIGALRQLAGDAATPEWEESLQGMLAFARSRDWVDEQLQAIRAHVER